MFSTLNLYAQSSLGPNSILGLSEISFASINSFEQNPSNYSFVKDWIFSLTYGAEFSNNITSNLYQVSTGKSFDRHYITLRYSPGLQKEFIFKSGEAVPYGNNEPITLESNFQYKELFGAGYSYKLSPKFSFGFNVRFFRQDFTQEVVSTVFSDSIYFNRETIEDKADFWKGDLGVIWQPINNLSFNFASINLFIINDKKSTNPNDQFELKKDKDALVGVNYSPFRELNLNAIYETNNSFQAGFSKSFILGTNKIGLSFSAFHDKEQNPFIAGINSSLLFISKNFDVSLSWLKYTSDRNSTSNFADFTSTGISNIFNNRFSFDKLLLTTNFKLNTRIEQKVKFIDVTIAQNIYPALAEKYIDSPIATATVVNLTDEKLQVKPVVSVNGFNEEKIQSPIYTLMPFDTSKINFYTMIPDQYSKLNPEISYANFYLMTVNDDYDDEFQKAILINGINAWDGNVYNLKYFIKKDLDYSINYSKNILSQNKSVIDTVITALGDFYKAKILFNELVKNLSYISDPRASEEYVQYPEETIKLKGGDCDDLSVCYSSLLESVGIETALVDYKNNPDLRHVNIMFNTKLTPQQAYLITENDTKYFIRKNEKNIDEVWISVETTSLSDFENAWSVASKKFQSEAIDKLGLVKGDVEIVDVY